MRRIYFAHPVNVYDTDLERQMLELIQEAFPKTTIENPNQPRHQTGYKEWKERFQGVKGKEGGMSYFYEVVLPECDSCIGMPFRDGKIGAGVAGEMKFFIKRREPVFCIVPVSPFNRQLNLEKTAISMLSREERARLLQDNSWMVLSVEETRARTWVSPENYGKMKLPYEDAHRVRFNLEAWTKDAIEKTTRVI